MVSNWWWHNGNNFLFQQKWGPIKHSCEKMGPLSTKSPALTYTNWLNNQPARAPFSYNAILSYVTQWPFLFNIVQKLVLRLLWDMNSEFGFLSWICRAATWANSKHELSILKESKHDFSRRSVFRPFYPCRSIKLVNIVFKLIHIPYFCK